MIPDRQPFVAGVDGARGGWVVVFLCGRQAEVSTHQTFGDVRAEVDARNAAVVAVDMPLGLAEDGPRAADREARKRLGARRSTLFPTPARAVLDATAHADAVARSRAAIGVGISVQAWNLMPRVREFRGAVSPAETERFVECHPETTFATLAGRPLVSKKTPDGQMERLGVLSRHIDDIGELLPPPRGCGVDDVLDAAAAALTAARVHAGDAEILGDAATDATGYPLRIAV